MFNPKPPTLKLFPSSLAFGLVFALLLMGGAPARADDSVAAKFHDDVEPILAEHCYGCHGYGMKKGNVSFDTFAGDADIPVNKDFWNSVLKNVRAGIMPPAKKPRLSNDELQTLADWIKKGPFAIDANNPDPGRVTIRRLNRVEYRNTIRDLMGIEFRAEEEFPPDDTGYGFDNNGDVLTLSPLLMEKYLQAAQAIVTAAVPTVAKVVQETTINGLEFRSAEGSATAERMSFYNQAKVGHTFKAEQEGNYKLIVDLSIKGSFDFDPGKCKVVFKVDDGERWRDEFKWEDNKKIHFESDEIWQPGDHKVTFELEPLTPPEKKKTFVDLRIASVLIRGPIGERFWIRTKNHARFFPKEEAPADPEERLAYARQVVSGFAKKAFRRPVDPRTIDRLTAIAEKVYQQPDKRFEQGIAQAMVAILASPRFLFRVEDSVAHGTDEASSLVDEYSLASRLSYFLWSTMPDDELFGLAERCELRKNLPAQVKRMIQDSRSEAFVQNFVGQWLQVRDVQSVPINAYVILSRDGKKPKFGTQFEGELRTAMQQETETYFSAMVHEDKSLLELIDSNYTYLNERLARHYGIEGVAGKEMRKVVLPAGDPRGGVLSQASVLTVTSNPTRTSPVKRGQFILDNILGTPAPPPPPDIPQLEESAKEFKDKTPTVRQMMEVHREKPLCNACHSRMDPLGLGLENFNALGQWRDQERGQPVDASGKLITGEPFQGVRDLKKILQNEHRSSFYRCLTEKMLTYALGRGIEYDDTEAVDQIVDRLEPDQGRFSTLLMGIIDSPPFQKRRNPTAPKPAETPEPKPGPAAGPLEVKP